MDKYFTIDEIQVTNTWKMLNIYLFRARETDMKTSEMSPYTTYLSEELKWQIGPNAREEVEKLGPSYLADGNVKWYSHIRKENGTFCFVYSKNKHLFTVQHSGFTLGHLS